jgi:hypothetical protein
MVHYSIDKKADSWGKKRFELIAHVKQIHTFVVQKKRSFNLYNLKKL